MKKNTTPKRVRNGLVAALDIGTTKVCAVLQVGLRCAFLGRRGEDASDGKGGEVGTRGDALDVGRGVGSYDQAIGITHNDP